MKSKEYIKTDTVIVGSGVAGVFAALCLPEDMDVLVITKEKLDECDSFLAQYVCSRILMILIATLKIR